MPNDPRFHKSDLYFINCIRECLGLQPIFDQGLSRRNALADADGRGRHVPRIDIAAYQRFGMPADEGNRRAVARVHDR